MRERTSMEQADSIGYLQRAIEIAERVDKRFVASKHH